MKKTERDFIAAILIIGLAAAVWMAYLRIGSESSNPQVAVCLDYREAERLAALSGKSVDKQLAELKQAGATHVALAEATLGDLLLSDRIIVSFSFGQTAIFGEGRGAYMEALQAKLPGLVAGEPSAASGPPAARYRPALTGDAFDGDVTVFRDIGVGYDPLALQRIKKSGLRLVARPIPDYCFSKQAIDYSLRSAKDAGAQLVIFNGIKVLGSRELLRYTADRLTEYGLDFGMIELVPQEGEYTLARALDGQVVRCHSVSAEEMEQMSPQRAFDRFLLAVTERKVRLCYVRLIFTGTDDLGTANADHLGSIATALQEHGYALGRPARFPDAAAPAAVLILIALGVLGGFLWLQQTLKELPARIFWPIAGAGLLLAVAVPALAPAIARPLVALAAALIFPILAISLIAPSYLEMDQSKRGIKVLWAAGLTARTALVTAIGGLLCAAALTDTMYLIKIEQFRGVKLAQLLPLAALLFILAVRATESYRRTAASRPRWQALKAGLGEIGAEVVKYWHVALIVLAAAALGYMLMRSGNEPSIGASGLEIQLRAALDKLLVVRPRTKEILLGYPALFVGIMLLLHQRRKIAWPLLAVGAISQVSLFNTFCHMHTPLVVSLARVVHGLWIGILVGLVWWGIKRLGDSYWAWVQRLEIEDDGQ